MILLNVSQMDIDHSKKLKIMKTGTMVALAAAGVAVGLLFGTKKGAQIRGTIADKALDVKDKIARASKDAMHELAELRENVSQRAKEFEDKARRQIADTLEDGADAASKMKAKVKTV